MEPGEASGAPRPAVVAARRPLRPPRPIPRSRIMLACAAVAAALHSFAVLWTWWSGAPGLRSGWLVWLDLPVSLVYLHVMGERLLWWSFVAGGLQWAVTGALLALVVGWSARRP